MTSRTPPPDPLPIRQTERSAFRLLLIALSIGFVWIIWPYAGAVFWAFVLALLFEPLKVRLARRWKGRDTLAALATLGIILLIVILPMALITVSLMQEFTSLYQRLKGGQMDLGQYVTRFVAALPTWAMGFADRLGLGDLAGLQARLGQALSQRGQELAGRAVDVGQNVLDFAVGFCISMYVLFFLLRDGRATAARIRAAIPLEPKAKDALLERFTKVIQATVKGNVIVAAVQGALGGLAFWVLGVHAPILWAVVMAFLSLLPAVGAALVWGPVALYLLATGSVWSGIGLIVFGVLVIGLIDNVLRPILVGRDTQMPDYMVLVSTVGGLAVVGLSGFVIGPVIAAMFLGAWELFAASRQRSGVDTAS